jgi:hypothetical protein
VAQIDPLLQPIVRQAVADLGTRLAVDPARITPVSAQAVVWPDRSAGCPQPGMNYLQVQVDGAKIELSFEEKIYTYHLGGPRGLFLCERAQGASGAPGASGT